MSLNTFWLSLFTMYYVPLKVVYCECIFVPWTEMPHESSNTVSRLYISARSFNSQVLSTFGITTIWAYIWFPKGDLISHLHCRLTDNKPGFYPLFPSKYLLSKRHLICHLCGHCLYGHHNLAHTWRHGVTMFRTKALLTLRITIQIGTHQLNRSHFITAKISV